MTYLADIEVKGFAHDMAKHGYSCCECGFKAKDGLEFREKMQYRSALPWGLTTAFVCNECWPAHAAKHGAPMEDATPGAP